MLKTFSRGGVHPNDYKITAHQEIEKIPIPEQVIIPLAQHIGAPAKPVIKPTDQVKVGDLIAESSGFISANIHSPVSGKVLRIDDAIDTSGYKQKSIIIKVEGDAFNDGIDLSDSLNDSITIENDKIIPKVLSSGIVGLGGATFPSHVKLSIPEGKKCDFLIINGVECEPYLTSDHRLMLEKGKEIVVGVRIILKALGVKKALIGIENNKKDAIQSLDNLTSNSSDIEVHPLKVHYPQGGEKQLVKALVNREIPAPPGLPIDVGCVVFNVGTVYAIYEAVQKNKPLFERVVTITGKSLEKGRNFLVRIGTPINHLLAACGISWEKVGKVISGGPMMGKALSNIEIPVTKGTSGILLMDESESKRNPIKNCIRCARCVTVCPLGLEPYLISTYSRKSLFEQAESNDIISCIECGCCSYTCPSNRPLLDYIRHGKSTVMKMIRARGRK